MTYNRYSKFTKDGKIALVPFIKIPVKNTDYYDYYKRNETRLDKLSYQYYDDPNYGWLILQANPEFGGLEFRIPHMAKLRIPFPLESTLIEYNSDVDTYDKLYGLDF